MRNRRRKKVRVKVPNKKLNWFKKGRKTTFLLIFLIGIGIFISLISIYCKTSDYFNISNVEIESVQGERLSTRYLENLAFLGLNEKTNIFSVGLNELIENVTEQHPEIESVRIRRRLPNTIVAYIKMRKPVAQIKLSRYYPIDINGVLLPGAQNTLSIKLPVLLGIDFSLRKSKIGKKIKSRNLDKAIVLIKELNKIGGLKNLEVKSIDLVDRRNISIFLSGGVEVKIGDRDFQTRLEKLKTILSDLPGELTEIKYIDLRFDDVVIGQR